MKKDERFNGVKLSKEAALESAAISRRELLKQALLAGAGGLLTGALPLDATADDFSSGTRALAHSSDFVTAVVIGSGFGGSAAALRLGQAGIDTVVIERGRRWRIRSDGNTFATFEQPDGRAYWLRNRTGEGILNFLTWVLLFSVTTAAQSGGNFTITQSVVAGGGEQNSTSAGGAFSLDGTIGQAVAGNSLVGSPFAVTSGFRNFNSPANQGIEGDVAPRAVGDGSVLSNDVVQVQRFQIGLDQPNQANELQRADSAPFSAKGDGTIQSNDVVQTQRYQIGLDAPQNAAGPFSFSGSGGFAETRASMPADQPEKKSVLHKTSVAPRELRVENAASSAGQQVQVNILVDAMGDESAYGFRVAYNQAILTNPTTTIGTAGGLRLCNTTTVPGQISCSINNFPNDNPTSSNDQIGEILPGNNQQLLRITFTVAANAPGGTTPITLSNVNASNDAAVSLMPITSQNGTVTVAGPTAANVSIGGRVQTADGRGIRNARVMLTAPNGETRFAATGSWGFYRFSNVAAGDVYFLTVFSKRFVFANPTRVVAVNDELADLDFTAEAQ